MRTSDASVIYVSKLSDIGSDNAVSPGRHQAIIWTNVGLLTMLSWEKRQWNLNRNSYIFSQENAFQNAMC